MKRARRNAGIGLLVASLTAAAWLTLAPQYVGDSGVDTSAWRWIAGDRWLADLGANFLLFVPLGAASFLIWNQSRRTWILAIAVTLSIEFLQWMIPGRYPSAIDPPANFLGAVFGHALLKRGRRNVRLRTRPAERCALAASLAFGAALFATSLLLVPSFPHSIYYGQWTADLGHLGHYDGSVDSVLVSTEAVGHEAFEFPEQLRRLLLNGGPVVVDAKAGNPPAQLAPVFSVYDNAQREIFLLGVQGVDLVVRNRRRADTLALDRPDLRVHGAMANVVPGEPIRITYGRDGAASCLGVDDAIRCNLGYSAGRGWALLYYPEGLRAGTLRLFDALWIAGLLAPVGFFARRTPVSYAALAVCIASLLLSSAPGALQMPGLPEWFGGLASVAALSAARHRRASRRLLRPRP